MASGLRVQLCGMSAVWGSQWVSMVEVFATNSALVGVIYVSYEFSLLSIPPPLFCHPLLVAPVSYLFLTHPFCLRGDPQEVPLLNQKKH